MNKLKRFFSQMLYPDAFNDLDTSAIGEALNDAGVRNLWLFGCFDELKRINLEVDRRLLSDTQYGLIDLCARRKAYQDMLESILSARRQVTQGQRPNPQPPVSVNLDRVTA